MVEVIGFYVVEGYMCFVMYGCFVDVVDFGFDMVY